jgi:transposase-like protein
MPKHRTSSRDGQEFQAPVRRRWREKDAREVLKEWRRSGLSARAFARALGLDPQRLLWWRRRLETTGGDLSPPTEETSTSALTLIPTTVVSPAPSASITVRLPRSVRIEIADPTLVPPTWIAVLLAELRKAAP